MPYNALNSLRKLVTSATSDEAVEEPVKIEVHYPRSFLGYPTKPGSKLPPLNGTNSKISKRVHYKYSKIFAKSKLSIHGSDDQKNAFAKNEFKSRSFNNIRKRNGNHAKDYWKHSARNSSASTGTTEISASSETISPPIDLDSSERTQVRSSASSKNKHWDLDFLEVEKQANLIRKPHRISSEENAELVSSSGKPRTTLGSPKVAEIDQKVLPQEKLKKSGVIYKNVSGNEDGIVALVPDLSKTFPVYPGDDEEKSNVIDKYSQYVSQFRYIPLNQSLKCVNVSTGDSVIDTTTLSSEILNQGSSSRVKTSPVSKETPENVSDSRTFLMTREAYNQAQILGFAFNENQKQTKSSYAVDFKLCVVEWFINNGRNTSATAEKFQIDRKQVYSWHKEREKLKIWANKITNNKQIPSRRLVQKGEWSMYKLLDDRLFDRCSALNGVITVSNEALRLAAIEEAQSLGYKNFKASYIWLQMWKNRMERKHNLEVVLKNRRLIQWKFPQDSENNISQPP